MQNSFLFVVGAGYYLRLVAKVLIVHKTAEIYDLNISLSAPFRVAVYVFGYKYDVAFTDG
jgi:hypothetical protein